VKGRKMWSILRSVWSYTKRSAIQSAKASHFALFTTIPTRGCLRLGLCSSSRIASQKNHPQQGGHWFTVSLAAKELRH